MLFLPTDADQAGLPVFYRNGAGLFVGRWPKAVGMDTCDLTADPIECDED